MSELPCLDRKVGSLPLFAMFRECVEIKSRSFLPLMLVSLSRQRVCLELESVPMISGTLLMLQYWQSALRVGSGRLKVMSM